MKEQARQIYQTGKEEGRGSRGSYQGNYPSGNHYHQGFGR